MFISMKNINMGTLGMLHHHHQNHNINLQQAYLHKKITSSLNSFHQLEENFCVYLQAKNQLHPTLSNNFWRYCKDMQSSYFGYFGQAWLDTPKMIVSTYRKLQCLSAYQKQTSSFTFFLIYYILKNPAI